MNQKEFLLKRQSLEQEYVLSSCDYEVGDWVEFLLYGDWKSGKISGFFVSQEAKIFAKVNGDCISIDGIHKFNQDDNSFRLKCAKQVRDLNVGDRFYLIVDKSGSTIGNKYTVFKKVEDIDGVIYQYYNDEDKPQSLYKGEYLI